MTTDNNLVSFPQLDDVWSYRIMALILFALGMLLAWLYLVEDAAGSLFSASAYALITSLACIWLLLTSYKRITVCPNGVRLYLWKWTVKEIKAENILTIVSHDCYSGRTPLSVLVVSPIPAAEMEQAGERQLRRDPIIRDELKFREGRSDWGDLCLGAGFTSSHRLMGSSGKPGGIWGGTLWMEFSPDRLAVLQNMFPHAAFRKAKRYYDPPSRT